MAEFKKFLFDNFVVEHSKQPAHENDSIEEDVEAEEERTAPEPEAAPFIPEPVAQTYTQSEVEGMLKKAQEEAYVKGHQSAETGIATITNELLADINLKLEGVSKDSCTLQARAEEKFVEMAQVMLQRLVPSLQKEHAKDIVGKFIADNFNNFKKEQKLSFYIHPDIISYIQDNIQKLANAHDFEGKISIHKDEKLAPNECRVEWENGGVECKTDTLFSKVGNLLNDKSGDTK